MSGAVSQLPQYVFMAWCLVKAQGQLYLSPLLLPFGNDTNLVTKILTIKTLCSFVFGIG